ncbi:hypothetical protein NDU88_003411 [Pleurodeles waltl]|uniref:Uncharacterized protein n=1 Tax=Pleurodeles waltl TaxID=8319 RepID=A0AAV7W606_PLEWA|nr:hypothetical protein NDU88_003411 [Pleurodeles waltl]
MRCVPGAAGEKDAGHRAAEEVAWPGRRCVASGGDLHFGPVVRELPQPGGCLRRQRSRSRQRRAGGAGALRNAGESCQVRESHKGSVSGAPGAGAWGLVLAGLWGPVGCRTPPEGA